MSLSHSAAELSAQQASALGRKDMLPASVAMASWGLVTGIAMVQSGLSTAQALGMSLMVYAGSAQLASLPLFAAGAPWAIIWASALIVNLRFVIYSVALKPFFRSFSFSRKLLFGVGTTDVLAADFLRRFDSSRLGAPALLKEDRSDPLEAPIAYFRASAVMIWLVWQSASVAGIFLAQWIPAAWGLEFVAILALIAMLLPMVVDRAALACITVAGCVAALTVSLPLNLGLLLAVIAGVAAAMAMDWFQSKPKEPHDGS
jgi:predicted branched-subunit amino acid permease